MTLGSVGSKSAFKRDLYLRRVFQMCHANFILSRKRYGHLEKEPVFVGGCDELAIHVEGKLGLGDKGALDSYLIDERGQGARIPENDLGASVVDVGAQGARLGPAAGNLLLFQ